jgi:NAD(P)-dependent dehydrogenase (short-subunit alcohol dehydrogenase family)
MKTVVITGSTRGIGLGLAESCLARGCSVMVSGRKREAVERTVLALSKKYPRQNISGYPCDVRDPAQVQSLWRESVTKFGHVDIWVNNAGMSSDQQMITESPPDQIEAVVQTNLLGLIYGSQVAARGMLQQGFGSIYNMEGMGSDGRMHTGLVFYGMSKYGVCYFTKGLAKELSASPIVIGALRPGMVATDMVSRQYEGRPEEWERAKKIFNIIADRVETVTPWLVDQMLKNKRSGVHLSWSNGWKILFRMLSQPFTRRDLFTENRSS